MTSASNANIIKGTELGLFFSKVPNLNISLTLKTLLFDISSKFIAPKINLSLMDIFFVYSLN